VKNHNTQQQRHCRVHWKKIPVGLIITLRAGRWSFARFVAYCGHTVSRAPEIQCIWLLRVQERHRHIAAKKPYSTFCNLHHVCEFSANQGGGIDRVAFLAWELQARHTYRVIIHKHEVNIQLGRLRRMGG
jgi:hypothetical protein